MTTNPFRRTMPKRSKSRKVAVAAALAMDPNAIFYEGNPCTHGHVGIRYIKYGHCRDCKEVLYAKNHSKRDVDRWKGDA
jgi:hypothetical protein